MDRRITLLDLRDTSTRLVLSDRLLDEGQDAAAETIRSQHHVFVGERIGAAIARDHLADDLAPRWPGLSDQDADQLTLAGIEIDSPEWEQAVEAARAEFLRRMEAAR